MLVFILVAVCGCLKRGNNAYWFFIYYTIRICTCRDVKSNWSNISPVANILMTKWQTQPKISLLLANFRDVRLKVSFVHNLGISQSMLICPSYGTSADRERDMSWFQIIKHNWHLAIYLNDTMALWLEYESYYTFATIHTILIMVEFVNLDIGDIVRNQIPFL